MKPKPSEDEGIDPRFVPALEVALNAPRLTCLRCDHAFSDHFSKTFRGRSKFNCTARGCRCKKFVFPKES